MNRRAILYLSALVLHTMLTGFAEESPSTAASATRPNIVFILADDMGFGDVGVNNPDSRISTPAMEDSSLRSLCAMALLRRAMSNHNPSLRRPHHPAEMKRIFDASCPACLQR